MTAQAEDLKQKSTAADSNVKLLKEEIERLRDELSEETTAKITACSKIKRLKDEAEQLNHQLKDEEESKSRLQNEIVQINEQVSLYNVMYHLEIIKLMYCGASARGTMVTLFTPQVCTRGKVICSVALFISVSVQK